MESGKTIRTSRRALNELTAVEVEASARLERRQLEMLMMHALKISGGDYSFVVSPAGKGAYAEQFVQLDAAASTNNNGEFQACHDSLSSRRADALTRHVMQCRTIAQGNVSETNAPIVLSGNHNVMTCFVMIPIDSGALRTSVLVVANPDVDATDNVSGDILGQLTELAEVISKRQQRVSYGMTQESSMTISDASEQLLHRLKTDAVNAVVSVNIEGDITAFNPAAERLFACRSQNAVGFSLDRYLSPKYFMPTLQNVQSLGSDLQAIDKLHVNHRSVSILDEDGEVKHLKTTAYYTVSDEGVSVSFVFNEPDFIDTDWEASRDFTDLVSTVPAGVIELNANWMCDRANSVWTQLCGLSESESLGSGWTTAIHSEDLMSFWVAMTAAFQNGQSYNSTIRLERPDGTLRWVSLAASTVVNELSQSSGHLIVFQDVSAGYRTQQRINHLAAHDALTGLVNRSAFLDKLQGRLNNRHLRNKTALLYLDVLGLKSINSTMGYNCGDEVLRQLASRIQIVMNSDGVCARLSGSKFAVILMGPINPVGICSVAEQIINQVKDSFYVFGEMLTVNCAIGISMGDDSSESSDHLLEQADTALAEAKISDTTHWKVFTPKLNTSESVPLPAISLNSRIRQAVENNDFTLDYQPQYRLDEEEIVSFEAMLRWVPGDFPAPKTAKIIASLESMGLIHDVGAWVLETACQQFMVWNDIGLLAPGCTMSVNVSPLQLKDSAFVSNLSDMLQSCNMAPGQLNLEFSESALDASRIDATDTVKKLKMMGVQLSLEGAGIDGQWLSSLNRLPVDFLKIDRSFVKAMDTDEPSRSMVMSMLAMANTLDVDVVADGIDSSDILGELRAAQCKFVQGDLISKPASAKALEPLLIRKQFKYEDVIQLF